MKMLIASVCAGLALVLAGCAAWFPQQGVKQAGSIVDYLYPDAKEPPQLKPAVTYLRPPVRVGIAFVPGGGWGTGLPEAEQTKLLEQVRAAFRQYDFIGGIEVIPTQYLREKGGFQNSGTCSNISRQVTMSNCPACSAANASTATLR